jgi:hypothetical protein
MTSLPRLVLLADFGVLLLGIISNMLDTLRSDPFLR